MPIYEFHCGQCGKDSELLVRSTNWKGTACPHCGSTRLGKKFSVFATGGSSAEVGGPCCGRGGGGGHACGGACACGHGH